MTRGPSRRRALGALTSLGLGLSLARSSPAATLPELHGSSHAARVGIAAGPEGVIAPRGILGANVQWADRGDAMLLPDGSFDPVMLDFARRLAPTSMRYPGGDLADNYHWARGIGPLDQRQSNLQTGNRTLKPTVMGTLELLELCEATGAAPLLSVNIATGTADEAAQWLAWTNRQPHRSRLTGRMLPPVRYWELGNEPYLKIEHQPNLWTPPEVFAERADAFIKALRAVDPTIVIGLPLCNDFRNGVPVNQYPGFADTVLAKMTGRFDAVCLHNAYAPFAFGGPVDADTLYWAAMASTPTVEKDFDTMRQRLDRARPGHALPFAVTEYNAIFTLGRGVSDGWIISPAAALYVADALRLFATRPDVPMANLWSLSGNWWFGMIHQDHFVRPAYEVLKLYGELLQGRLQPVHVRCDTVAVPSISTIEAAPTLPLIEALATRDGHTLRLLMIHKDPQRQARVTLDLPPLAPAPATAVGSATAAIAARAAMARVSVLSAPNPMRADDRPNALQRDDRALALGEDGTLTLAPHSVSLLTLRLAAAT